MSAFRILKSLKVPHFIRHTSQCIWWHHPIRKLQYRPMSGTIWQVDNTWETVWTVIQECRPIPGTIWQNRKTVWTVISEYRSTSLNTNPHMGQYDNTWGTVWTIVSEYSEYRPVPGTIWQHPGRQCGLWSLNTEPYQGQYDNTWETVWTVVTEYRPIPETL